MNGKYVVLSLFSVSAVCLVGASCSLYVYIGPQPRGTGFERSDTDSEGRLSAAPLPYHFDSCQLVFASTDIDLQDMTWVSLPFNVPGL